MTLFSCQDTRSRKTQNKEQYPPQKLFEGKQLEAAQKIFDEDNSGLESVLKDDPQIINQLSDNKGYTLLMYASVVENLPAMEILLKNGADPNIVVPNEGLGLPLSHAVALNNYKMAKLLFKYKANPNPELGNSPLCNAMSLGNEQIEKKMIDFLLDNGADINHISYLGHNIMEEAARNLSQFRIALYLLEKGGNPKIKGTELSPMAKYIEYEKKKTSENKNPKAVDYYENLLKVSTILQEKYHITFPVKDDPKAEAKLRIELYEKLSEKDKKSVNFNKNYGENRYKEDQKLLLQ
ncbi:Ankyrin repeat-containing protein [Chryseobacterium indoltheticum]|uniref:Ankyrin repeat-containing protein n=2 Tax=Chryseobacterium indoltheticum TaxID=254 RepID=A0A381JSM3_9FLAO|nr:ankyrin repeat domain-containing protein [Chryseobacterium indoltheticum]SIR32950.1 Ankyrin repeat-containing protein [Chryseobacterium indoltheticum]SUY54025.1 Ankyrin repeats (3 copies) [Chryseobacterium indoltheticum]